MKPYRLFAGKKVVGTFKSSEDAMAVAIGKNKRKKGIVGHLILVYERLEMKNTEIHLEQVSALVSDNDVSIHSISETDFIAIMTNNDCQDLSLITLNDNYFTLSLKLNSVVFFSGKISRDKYDEMLDIYKFDVPE